MRRTTAVAAGIGAVILTMQLFRVDRVNPAPAAGAQLDAPPEVSQGLRRACFDCHSNETKWPWYSAIAPMSWLVAHDVREGRHRLNFSDWADYASDPGTERRKREEIARALLQGTMAPFYYRLLHPDSYLVPSERDLIARWAEASTTSH